MNNPGSLEEFRQSPLVQGCDEVREREWPASTVLAEHAHPFAARALVVRGEMWLRIGDLPEQHLRAGDTFEVGRGVTHAERYGPEGATFWVGRFR